MKTRNGSQFFTNFMLLFHFNSAKKGIIIKLSELDLFAYIHLYITKIGGL